MKIKSLLIGSAAALASATVVNAADAIVAAEPEAVEYVRVCDAFGTGFFYIPGTETCLKIGGYVRFQVDFGRDESGTSDWTASSKGLFTLDARNETELGTLRSFMEISAANQAVSNDNGLAFEQAFIELGGFRAGYFKNWWDDDLSGETDNISGTTRSNSVRYSYDAGGFQFGLAVEELEGRSTGFARFTVDETAPDVYDVLIARQWNNNNVGVSARAAAALGGVNFELLGGYDTDVSEGAIRAILTADLGPGTLGLAGVWSSGANAYYSTSEWAIAAEYAVKVSDRLTITPAVQWNGNRSVSITEGEYDFSGATPVFTALTPVAGSAVASNFWSDHDSWKAGVTVDYVITSGLTSKISLQYEDIEGVRGLEGHEPTEEWSGFVRLQRSF